MRSLKTSLGLLLAATLLGWGLVGLGTDSYSRFLLDSSARGRLEATAQLADLQVNAHLGQAEQALQGLARRFTAGLVHQASLEEALRGELLERTALTEAGFTFASGDQIFAWRDSKNSVHVSRVQSRRGVFSRNDTLGQTLTVDNPTLHPTYSTLASPQWRGRALWSDLHHSSWEPARPRVMVSIQKALYQGGRVIGVARVGIDTSSLTERLRKLAPPQHRLYLCDERREIVIDPELGRASQWTETPDGELRLPAHPSQSTSGLLSLVRPLEQHPYWQVVVVVDPQVYLGALQSLRSSWLGLVCLAGGLSLLLCLEIFRRVERDLKILTRRAEDFESYRFVQEAPICGFCEFSQLERALLTAEQSLHTLAKFAPKALVQSFHRSRKPVVLGGTVCQATILFSDLEGFSAIAEVTPVELLGERLGDYFRDATSAIHSNGGIVDKYLGDGLMALFNVPEPAPQAVRDSCRAALALVEASGKLWSRAETRSCVGIHTDSVLVGNFGAPDRMNYTALGDGVNLAARLEGLNRLYGTEIIVSEAVYLQAQADFEFRKLDIVQVKGKRSSVAIYQLLAPKGHLDAARSLVRTRYESALEHYLGRRFVQAQELWAGIGDRASEVMARRAQAYREREPENWSGVFVLEFK